MINLLPPEEAFKYRVKNGWQCPECYGIQINTKRDKNSDRVNGFECNECGCQFGGR